jgi:hypothetical protein
MHKLTRLGALILTIGLALGFVAVIRGADPEIGKGSSAIPARRTLRNSLFCVPRDLKLEIDPQAEVDVNITDPSGTIILNVQNVSSVSSFSLHLEKRGVYTFSVYNPSNATSNTDVSITFYNLEADILQASIILTIIGTAVIMAQRLHSSFKQRRVDVPSHEN